MNPASSSLKYFPILPSEMSDLVHSGTLLQSCLLTWLILLAASSSCEHEIDFAMHEIDTTKC